MAKKLFGLWQYEKVRYVLIGTLNTAVDFSILFSLVTFFAVPALIANIASTSTALVVSYLLNKRAVFGDTDTHNPRQVVLFVVVTLAGLWILQGLVIEAVRSLAHAWLPAHGSVGLLAAKAIATLFSLTWNYLWYSRVVFRGGKAK